MDLAANQARNRRMEFGKSASPRALTNAWLRDDLADHLAVIDLQPLAAGDFQPARVEAELVQHRGVDVGDVVAVLDGVRSRARRSRRGRRRP